MQFPRKAAQAVSALVIAAMVAGCTLPRSGPTTREILSGGDNPAIGLHIVSVTPAVAAATHYSEPLGFGSDFTGAGLLGADVIRAGDTLSVAVWENVDAGLLAGVGQKVTAVDQLQVDQAGNIFMPYVGQIEAAGRTPEQLRTEITRSLAPQTPDPQVEVRRIAGDGSTVSVLGAVASAGVYPIEAPTRRLSSMLARAGGVGIEPDIAQIRVERNGRVGRVWLQDLYDTPAYDIALRGGDKIIVEQDRRAFTALGATEQQARVNFTKPNMSAIEAIAAAGGLDGDAADPTGIFVFRSERADVASRVLGGVAVSGPQRMAYVMNLTEPEGMFAAREFTIRDEDTVYITEAPFKAWRQIIGLTATTVALGGSVAAIASR
ncbi:polysaccharide biosynthesis/export family protein [Rhodobacteraceae bacterium DSL-40]|uniref:polysaccharide biosynthesis/export family protein n=1 Tax=Amaricoccus sp. B4 TaxID=3368557 RepID=UPI000DAC8B7F